MGLMNAKERISNAIHVGNLDVNLNELQSFYLLRARVILIK
jgi:hypothetical protein